MRRKTRALLNKMTMERFSDISEQLSVLPVTSADELTTVVHEIFDKAITEHHYCEVYADMCLVLRQVYPEFEEDGVKTNLTRVLLTRCQEEFAAELLKERLFDGIVTPAASLRPRLGLLAIANPQKNSCE